MKIAIETIVTPAISRPSSGSLKGLPHTHVLLAHGAGAPMTSPFMEQMARLIANEGINVHRFEFSYMAERRKTGKRRPPPRAESLMDEFKKVLAHVLGETNERSKIFIGGKSMGGRIATMIADRSYYENMIGGTVALGYPFHPARKSAQLRTAHLEKLSCPTLVIQGERDPLGNRDEVKNYRLSQKIKLHWAPDGDHDLCPRKRSGKSHDENLKNAAQEIATFIAAHSGDN